MVKKGRRGDLKPLNILHTVEFYHPHVGGSETVVQTLSELLVQWGHSVTVATTRDPQRDYTVHNGVFVIEFDVAGSAVNGYRGSEVDRYREFLKTFPADIMTNYAAQQWATDLAFEVLGNEAIGRVNLVAPCGYSALRDVHEFRWSEYAEYYRTSIPETIPRYDAAVYHAKSYQDFRFARYHGFTNSVVIPNGVSAEEFDEPAAIDFRAYYGIETRHMGLCVANYLRDKGQRTLVDVVQQMARDDFTMVFIGQFGEELDAVRVAAAGLRVKILVDIPRPHTVAAFKQADIFLFASRIEAAPLVLIEAMASKTPFVSTDCGNAREYAGGIVCDVDELAAVAGRILDDSKMRTQLAEGGYRQWRGQLTWTTVAATYETLYRDLYIEKFLAHQNAESEHWRNHIDGIQQRIDLNYADVSLYLRAALLLRQAGALDESRAYAEDALELQSDNPVANMLVDLAGSSRQSRA